MSAHREKKKNITLKEVAERANVSVSTVSFVLNKKGDISIATRDRVLRAAAQLSYHHRPSKSRVDSLTKILFVKIAKHGQTVNRDHSHFIADYIDGMSEEASRRNYSLEVDSHEGEDMLSLLNSLEKRNPCGVIILGTELSEDDIVILSKLQKPLVVVDTFYPFINVNFVDMDNDQAIHSVVYHLKFLGFKRVGFVGGNSDVTNFKLRELAFKRACHKLGISVHSEDQLSVSATRDRAYKESKAYFEKQDNHAEAYFCANDIIAFGVIRALQELGKKVPEDISIIGFDNLPACTLLSPSLTSVDVPKHKIGAMAIRILNDMIITSESQPSVKVLVSGSLILRESTIENPLFIDEDRLAVSPATN